VPVEAVPPPPPPVEVIVENIEGDPCPPFAFAPGFGSLKKTPAVPPAPTVIGVDVPPVNVIFVPPGKDVL
jgi:hypothetical protein